jgi:hypothetical protein
MFVRYRAALVLSCMLALGGGGVTAFGSVSVQAETNHASVRVGDSLTVTVRATRDKTDDEPIPTHASLEIGPEWETGSQQAESEIEIDSARVKTWRFALTARMAGQYAITPMVLLTQSPTGAPLSANKVLGPSVDVEILPPKEASKALRVVTVGAILAVMLFGAVGIFRAIQRRRVRVPKTPESPLDEALSMMEEVHSNCREDRATRFFADVERVIHGYLSRRIGRSLTGATGAEIVAIASEYLVDAATVGDLREVLRRCTTWRFSGGRADHATLADTEALTLSVLERLDAMWVPKQSSARNAEDKGM